MPSRSLRRSRPTPSSKKRAEKDGIVSLTRFILAIAILAWLFRSFVAAPFSIPSGSMLPTLYIGDYLVVSKWPYGFSRFSFPFGVPAFSGRIFEGLPARGDVVVFRHPSESSDLIKRVIGLPGDTVEVRGGRLILNGHAVPTQALPPVGVPVTANSPCRVVPPAAPTVIILSGNRPVCGYRAHLETLPGGPTFTVLDQVDHGIADDFPPAKVPAGHVFLMGDRKSVV